MLSKSCVSVVLLASVLLLVLPVRAEERPGQLAHDLSFSLTVSIVAVCVVIMLIVGIVLLHRAKKGFFCCLKPRINYPVVRRRKQTTHAVRRNDPEDPRGPAPSYEVHPRGANIAPPDYEDALHDVLVYSAESHEQAETTIGDDTSLDADDHTPLNP